MTTCCKSVCKVAFLFLLSFFFIRHAVAEEAYFKTVIDGDTIRIHDGKRVRLIGIDAPEIYDGNKMLWDSRKWEISKEEIIELGYSSRKFLQDIFKKSACSGKILLRFDRHYVYQGHKDKYGRKLAYVYVPWPADAEKDENWVFEEIGGRDYVFTNATLLKAGYALVHFYSECEKKQIFIGYEEEARLQKRGLWNVEKGYSHTWEQILKMRKPSSSGYKIVY
ncbi:MAG: thermonuclease family protein [Candidatus Aureabacteria bacterium]|nr:thermonuclease family protein [Candidatus Auribacterota bacterium]